MGAMRSRSVMSSMTCNNRPPRPLDLSGTLNWALQSLRTICGTRPKSKNYIVCHACLSRNRKIVPLGEYHEIYNRVLCLNNDNQYVKVCWECLAVLKKIKSFESRCFIARKILCTKWLNRRHPKCLSNLSAVTPVKINIDYKDELTKLNDYIKTEGKFYTESPNTSSDKETYDYPNYNENDQNKADDNDFEENISNYHADHSSDYECFRRNKTENKCTNSYVEFDDTNVKCDSNEIYVFKNDITQIVKTENGQDANKIEFESKMSSNSLITYYDKKIDIKHDNKINSDISKVKLENKKVRTQRRKGLRKKDLEEHFRIVNVKRSEVKKYRVKIKINPIELESLRESERLNDVYANQPYKCHDCIYGFPSPKKKYEHDEKYHSVSIGRLTCDICDVRFACKRSLAAHVSRHYLAHACRLCGARWRSRRAHRRHALAAHRRAVLCAHCAACFTNVSQFQKHYKANHSVFICDVCGKRCRTKYTLEKHIRHHFESNVCSICNKAYASRNSLRNHCEMKHKVSSGDMAYCVKCDKQFANAPLYRRHVQGSAAHAAERDADRLRKQVSCPVCGNLYSRRTYMMNHYRHVHMKQSKYHCGDCDRHFLNRTRYVEHRKYHHEGEVKVKNKMCNICGRAFAANRTLVNHIRTHSGERPYECEHCDARFTQKHCMVSHVKYIHMKGKRREL